MTKYSKSKIIKEINKICKKPIISKTKISTQNLVNIYKVEVSKVKTTSNQVKQNSILISFDD